MIYAASAKKFLLTTIGGAMTFDDLQNNNLPSENLVEDLKIDLDLIKLTLLITKNIIILGIGALLPLVIGKKCRSADVCFGYISSPLWAMQCSIIN